MRKFIRHPIDVPVEMSHRDFGCASALHTRDVSLGGLALLTSELVPVGASVTIRIPQVDPPFEAHARVAWCRTHKDAGYEIGVTFLNAQDAFVARMVEQVCHIDDYRKSVSRLEGRELDSEQAAAEWIAKYAADFPDIGSQGLH
ncbi:MAG TPA: PilZ domain-containing protein [Burkholderiaceae bacterium]|nr:PilZ domain-containing protein [Burkholderiaceae bacterium]